MHRIYLDHAATTPLDPRVRSVMEPFFETVSGNPSSVHWHGRQAKAALEQARATVAGAIGAHVSEIFFTSGGTEGDNLAILGSVTGKAGMHLVTAATEHHAVLDTCRYLEAEGHALTVARVDGAGRVGLTAVESALQNGARFISVMHANNEVGTIHPVRALADLALRYDAVIHTDAVQSVGKIPVHVDELGVHMLTLSAHKIGGPKGAGVLYVRRGTRIEPLVHGGGQERGLRPGTENLALAVACAEAVRLAVAEREEKMTHLRMMRDALEAEIVRQFPFAIINGDSAGRLPQILSVSFDAARCPMEGEMLVTNMDLEGISVSSGSACTSGSVQPSHVLLAMGRDEGTAKATLRFSFGSTNAADDVAVVLDALKRVIGRMTGAR